MKSVVCFWIIDVLFTLHPVILDDHESMVLFVALEEKTVKKNEYIPHPSMR